MRLRYTSEALAHLRSIYSYIAERNPAAAHRVMADIRSGAERLRSFPHMGRNGDQPGTREWVVRGSPYIAVYQVDESGGEIVVIGVFHGAQDRTDRQP
jgi:addiction module RelE/StbE family toxin